MDTELARTFLMVAATGNFVAAASRLHVTQSTVSARINTLETTLGARLFQRGRNGADLTPAGKRFMRHAKHLVRTVEQALHDVGLPQGFRDVLTLSGRIALWEDFLPHWVAWMREAAPDVSLRLEIGFEADIMQGLIEGTVDIGVMYTPTSRPGLVVEPLFDETLLLVTSDLARGWPDDGYIHIDWGPEFHAQFSEHYPDAPPPALVMISGHGPQSADGAFALPLGKLGRELTVEQGYVAARLTALSILGSLQRELGDLDRIAGWVRVFGMGNSAAGFNRQPSVINGFSDLILELFGPELGAHSRSAVGLAELPFDIPVEIEGEVELRP